MIPDNTDNIDSIVNKELIYLKNIKNLENNKHVKFRAYLNNLNIIFCRNGSPIGMVNVFDSTGSADLVLFCNILCSLLEVIINKNNGPFLFSGSLDKGVDGFPDKVIIDDILVTSTQLHRQ